MASGALLAFLLSNGVSLAQEVRKEFQNIIADFKLRQDRARTIRYGLRGQGLIAKGRYSGEISLPPEKKRQVVPEKDFVYEKALTWTLDFENNKLRKEFKEQVFHLDVGDFVPSYGIYIFDGNTTQRYLPRESNSNKAYSPSQLSPELGLVKNGNTIEYSFADGPVYWALGIMITTSELTGARGPENLRLPFNSRNFRFQGKRITENKECVVLRTVSPKNRPNDYDEFWIDPAQESAVLRMDAYLGGKLYSRVDVQYREQGDYPQSWTVANYNGKPHVETTDNLRVVELAVNPAIDPSEFEIPLRPGMIVRRADAKGSLEDNYNMVDYRVDSDGKTLVPLGDGQGRNPWWPRRVLLWGIPILVALVAIAWYLKIRCLPRFGRERK